jgi:glycosyltransferase involved in cell wall biosynthesis
VRRHVAADKIVVVPNGVFDWPPDLDQRHINRMELELPPDAPAVAFAAWLEQVKNPLAFVEFARGVHAQIPGARFLVAGDGPLREAMHERVLALNLLPAFRFLGFLPDLDAFFSAADLFVLTSVSEGVPLVALEAMRAERPVIAPAVGGLPEILAGLGELTAPPGDLAGLTELAVNLLRDPARLTSIGKSARARFLAAYTAERMARETKQVYDAVHAEGA